MVSKILNWWQDSLISRNYWPSSPSSITGISSAGSASWCSCCRDGWLENLWNKNKKSQNQLCCLATHEGWNKTKQQKPSRFCCTASHYSSVRGGWGGGGIKFENLWNKKPQINSVGWQHTRVDNNKTNKAQAGRFCSTAFKTDLTLIMA